MKKNNPKLAVGDVIKIDMFYENSKHVPGERWGIVLDVFAMELPDAMVFTRDEKGEWHSKVSPVGGDDVYHLAAEDEIPDDVPDDFWPLAARYALGVTDV